MSSQAIHDDPGAKSTNWLAGWLTNYTDCQPHFHVCRFGAFFGHIQLGDEAIRANDTYFQKISH